MRNIKFRIWDKEQRIYINKYDSFQIGFHRISLLDGDINNQHDNFIFQQFTGLTDKNGKEIYEGDIIQYNYPKNERNNKVLVRWTTEEHDNHPGFIIRDSFEQYGDYEIVGNMYENPDLV